MAQSLAGAANMLAGGMGQQNNGMNDYNSQNFGSGAVDCAANPTAPSCQQQQAQGEGTKSTLGFSDGASESRGAGKFNLADNADTSFNPRAFGPGQVPDSGVTYQRPANNSGGAIPGQQAGAMPPNGAPPPPRPTGVSGSGSKTDIEKGFMSGGGGGGAEGGGGGGGSAAPPSTDERAASTMMALMDGGRDPSSAGMPIHYDLKQHLKNGALKAGGQASYGLGGSLRRHPEIHGPTVNPWLQVTGRLRQICRLPKVDCG